MMITIIGDERKRRFPLVKSRAMDSGEDNPDATSKPLEGRFLQGQDWVLFTLYL